MVLTTFEGLVDYDFLTSKMSILKTNKAKQLADVGNVMILKMKSA